MVGTSGVLQARGIHGLLIAPLPPQIPYGHLSLDWPKFAVVTFGYSLWKPDLDRIVPNGLRMSLQVLRELRRLGYRRIGLAVPSFVDDRCDKGLSAAFLLYQQRSNTSNFSVLTTRQWDEVTFGRWFRKHQPEVVVGMWDDVPQWLRRMGKRIPRDVGFASFDVTAHSGSCAGLLLHHEFAGAMAVELLAARLQHNEFGVPKHPCSILLESTWVDGGTVRDQRRWMGSPPSPYCQEFHRTPTDPARPSLPALSWALRALPRVAFRLCPRA